MEEDDSLKNEFITIQKNSIDVEDHNEKYWSNSQKPLKGVKTVPNTGIEDSENCIQIDFANRFLGGGVLRKGSVQEEIMFLIKPENLALMMFVTKMAENEAIYITGTERMNKHSGYSSKTKFQGDYNKEIGIDEKGRKMVRIHAIDADRFGHGNAHVQFEIGSVMREVNKAYVGFLKTG